MLQKRLPQLLVHTQHLVFVRTLIRKSGNRSNQKK
jgi:hypothetical protein